MNNEHLLQLAKHLGVHGGLKSDFESAYSIDGLHILPPLMTEIKRLEMQQLRLQALAIEMSLKRNKPSIGEKKMKCLMPRMVNASTNTAMKQNSDPNPNPAIISVPSSTSGPAPLIVMGRFRQELQKSKTAVYDHSTNELTTLAPPKTLPLLVSSHVVIEDAPQRAVITPVKQGTTKSSWVSCEPQQCSTTTIDLRVLNDQERLPGRPVVLPSPTQISGASPKTAQSVFRSQIPTRSTPGQPKILAPQASMIAPGHASCHKPSPVKTDTANERRRIYGAKVTMMRNELTKKREELAKLKPPPRIINNNVPKSIRTPIRRGEGGEFLQPEIQLQGSAMTNNQVIKSIRTPIRQGEGRECHHPETQQQGSTMTNNNQVIKSIRTPIRRGEGREFLQPEIQQEVSTMTNTNQVIKSIRTPIRRVEGGLHDTKMLQNPFQSVISRQELDQQSLQSQKLSKTPVVQMEVGECQGTDIHQQGSLEKQVKIIRTPIIRGEAEEFPASESQQHGTTMTNNQVFKSIRIPIRRVDGPEFLGSQLQLQRNRFKSLFSRHENEAQRLQAQQEQQQQGLIDQMLGHIDPCDGQDTASEFLVDQDQ